MKRFYTYFPIIAAIAAIIISGCAKTRTESAKDDLRDYFLAWMEANHPDIRPSANGVYLLEETYGSGLAYENHDFAYIDITIADIEGNISSTTNKKVSQQIGTFNQTYYYGPTMNAAGDNVSAGVHYILSGMRKGGTKKAIIPFWLNTYSRYDTQEEYYKNATTSSANVMYTIHLKDFTNDEDQWEIDSLETYLAKRYRTSPDSVSYGRYYYQITPPTDEEDFPTDTTIYINYTGRLLNGQVFDTTIKDTAIVHNIYSSSNTYEPKKVSWASDASSITLESSSVISGFYNTLWGMHKYEKGIGYFISSNGYSSSGSGSIIPAYSPLCFEIEIVDAP